MESVKILLIFQRYWHRCYTWLEPMGSLARACYASGSWEGHNFPEYQGPPVCDVPSGVPKEEKKPV